MTFKVGDKVRFNYSERAEYILNWRRANGYRTLHGGDEFTVQQVHDNGNITIIGSALGTPRLSGYNVETWESRAFDLVQTKPTLATTLALSPGDRTILAHLEAGKPITPMKALVVYGLSRLAAHVYRIRKAGYNVKAERLQDEGGHKYASYSLVAQ